MTKKFPNSGLEVISNEYYYLVINHKKGGSFRLISRDGNYADAGVLKKIKETELTIYKSVIFNLVNIIFGWSRTFRKLLRAYLRKKIVIMGEYEVREFNISAREIIVKGKIGRKEAYTGNQSSRYYSPAELWGRRLKPEINHDIRTFKF